MAKPLGELRIEGYDVVLADLGVSSMQLDDPARGFSYKHDGPLDMRMDDRLPHTAADLLRTLSEKDLAEALRTLSDEPDAERIARRIVEERDRRHCGPGATTLELARLVCEAKGLSPQGRGGLPAEASAKAGKLHPAALTFQALRMLVNDELGALKQLLRLVPHCLRPGGRVGIISFHSGEDRLVKHSFRDSLRAGLYAEAGDEPIRPAPEEIRSNPRSASAKFRWARTSSA